jgi:anti-sigma factor RsiW
MECPQENGDGAELIIAYVARRLDSDHLASFERHLKECGCCRKTAAEQRIVWSALDELIPLPVSSNFDAKLYQRIAREERHERKWLFRASWSWPLAATCAILVVALLLKNSVSP